MKTLVIALSALAIGISAPAFANKGVKGSDWFAKSDANGDGYISQDEHARWSDNMFDRADTNRDGMISRSEFNAQKAKKQAVRRSSKAKQSAKLAPRAGTGVDAADTSENQNIKDTKPQ